MIGSFIEFLSNFASREFFFYNLGYFYFFINVCLPIVNIISFSVIAIYYFNYKKVIFSKKIMRFTNIYFKLFNIIALFLDIFFIEYFGKIKYFSYRPIIIIYDDGIPMDLFLFSITSTQLFFIFLLHLIIFFISFTYKYEDTYNFSIKTTDMDAPTNYITGYFYFAYIILVSILNLTVFIIFTTQNIIVFFIAFEFSVIPIFFMIGFFGKRSQKFKAMNYIFFFTMASSIPMLIGIIYIYQNVGSLNLFFIRNYVNSYFSKEQIFWLFICFYIPFSVKIPMAPFHTWLPEAHVEASTEGSMLLAGIMLKLGIYGFIKFNLFIFSSAIPSFYPFIIMQGTISAIIASLSMYKQLDIKKIIAYSSIVHMNIGVIAFFAPSSLAFSSSIILVFSHGLTSTGLFLCLGILQNHFKDRNLLQISGLIHVMPKWSYIFGFLCFANAALPPTFSFIAELNIIIGLFEHFPIISFFLYFPIAICSHRNFLLFTQLTMGNAPSFFNPFKIKISNKEIEKNNEFYIIKIWDVSPIEFAILIQIVVLIFFWGINPEFLLRNLNEINAIVANMWLQ